MPVVGAAELPLADRLRPWFAAVDPASRLRANTFTSTRRFCFLRFPGSVIRVCGALADTEYMDPAERNVVLHGQITDDFVRATTTQFEVHRRRFQSCP